MNVADLFPKGSRVMYRGDLRPWDTSRAGIVGGTVVGYWGEWLLIEDGNGERQACPGEIARRS